MSLHKSGAQKRKERKKREDNERGLQTLLQVGMKKKGDDVESCIGANLEESKSSLSICSLVLRLYRSYISLTTRSPSIAPL